MLNYRIRHPNDYPRYYPVATFILWQPQKPNAMNLKRQLQPELKTEYELEE